MPLYLKLAWRNLWRNRRRTLISIASVLFAVLFSLIMRSMQHGSYDYMIQSSVGVYVGYIQVHGEGYWKNRSLDESLEPTVEQLQRYASIATVSEITPRLETFALLSKDSLTKVAQVIGIDPSREDAMTGLSKRLVKGRFLGENDRAFMIGEGLSTKLSVSVGDSIVLYGQGYHGVTAAERIPVAGILHFPIPELDNAMAYLSLRHAQWVFSAPGRITSIAFMLESPSALGDAASQIRSIAGSGVEVMDWKEMMPELVQAIEVDSAGGVLMLLILYVVIGFGIFGTVMMMTSERQREFGILLSIGMSRRKLVTITTLETLMISLQGALLGVAVGIPLLWYFHLHPIPLTGEAAEAMLVYGLEPILPFSIAPGIFLAQSAAVLGLAAVCALYPLQVIRKLQPVAALRT